MHTSLRISFYVLGLVVVFAAATGIGSLVGPMGNESAAVTHTGGTDHGDMQPGSDHPADD